MLNSQTKKRAKKARQLLGGGEVTMGIIIALIIGGGVGWLAAAITGRNEGLVGSVAIGVVGSIIGGLLSIFLTGSNQSLLGFSWWGLVWSFIGALILVAILNAVQYRGRTQPPVA